MTPNMAETEGDGVVSEPTWEATWEVIDRLSAERDEARAELARIENGMPYWNESQRKLIALERQYASKTISERDEARATVEQVIAALETLGLTRSERLDRIRAAIWGEP